MLAIIPVVVITAIVFLHEVLETTTAASAQDVIESHYFNMFNTLAVIIALYLLVFNMTGDHCCTLSLTLLRSHPFHHGALVAIKQQAFTGFRAANTSVVFKVCKDATSSTSPDNLAVAEPRISGEKALETTRKMGFDKFYIVDALGFSGGLWLFWNEEDIQVSIQNYGRQWIHFD
ncbi:hypothetical protein Syun_025396 [Stephania yunnanensis]|uniref:Uncharacterized protein n=1 Tax=Stephania yunnanensis TaxID=152371 RepID=A0AAP0ES47_9MAGN